MDNALRKTNNHYSPKSDKCVHSYIITIIVSHKGIIIYKIELVEIQRKNTVLSVK